jgi:Tol biopolymer transport system component
MRQPSTGLLLAGALMAVVFAVLVPAAASRTSSGAIIDNADDPVWSPDSRLIAFVYSPRWNSPDRIEEIDTLDPITGRQRVAVPPFPAGTELYGLDWSAGGRDLVFSACCPQNVWISRLDGRAPVLLVPGGRDARWSPEGGELAFISADEQLEVMRSDGSLRRVLAPARVFDRRTFGRRIAWAPDASHIAYISGGDIFVYSFSDRRASRLTATAPIEDSPVWAPDGSLIAYTRGPDHFVVRPDGTGQKVLYDDPDPDEVGANPLSWAPDSRHVTFSRDRVWIASPRTGERRPAIDRGFASDASAQASSWSPDGRRIAYIASRLCPGPLPNALAVADVSLRRARFLTANCVRRGTQGVDHLSGTSQNELFYGFRGDDVIRAAGGSDVVQGGRGNDRLDSGRGQVSDCGRYCDVLHGGPGDDIVVAHEASSRLAGGLGRDRLVGGPGYDLMLGGRGIDHLSAGGGRDSIHVRDGFRDYVRCGRDADFVAADSLDVIARDCERVRRR